MVMMVLMVMVKVVQVVMAVVMMMVMMTVVILMTRPLLFSQCSCFLPLRGSRQKQQTPICV